MLLAREFVTYISRQLVKNLMPGTIDQLSRLAPILDGDRDRIEAAIAKAPKNYRKLVRLGVFGATVPYFLCNFQLRGTDLQGKTVVAPWFRSEAKRCQEPEPEPEPEGH